MSRATRNRWIDVIGVIVALAVGAGLMYFLLPLLVRPDQQVVPPLPKSVTDPVPASHGFLSPEFLLSPAFLMMFIPMTAIGAPVTLALVLVLIMRKLSPVLPASSSAAPDTSSAQPTTTAKMPAPKEMSPREAVMWKIIATLLSLAAIAGLLALFWPSLAQLFSGG